MAQYRGYRPNNNVIAGRGFTGRPGTPTPNITVSRPRSEDDQGNPYTYNGIGFSTLGAIRDYRRGVSGVGAAAGLTPEQMGGIAKNWGDQAPLYIGQMQSDQRAIGEGQANTDKAVGTLQNSWDTYLNKYYNPARDQAIATQQQAISQYIGSPAQAALTRYADPGYKAMSDEFVGQQRALASRGIAKEQANATAAGVALAGRSGYQGSGITPALTAAAGYRGAGDRATVNAGLASDQLQYNTDFNRWATDAMSSRDAEAARLRGDLAERQGTVAPANPYAGQMAALQNERPVYMPDFTQVPTQEERDRFLGSLGMSQEQAMASLTEVQKFYQTMQQQAQTAEDKAQATDALNVVAMFISFLGLTPEKLLGYVGL